MGNVDIAVKVASNVDTVLGVEEVLPAAAKTTGVTQTDEMDREGGIVEKPTNLPSMFVTAGCYVLPEDIFHACALLRLSAEGEY